VGVVVVVVLHLLQQSAAILQKAAGHKSGINLRAQGAKHAVLRMQSFQLALFVFCRRCSAPRTGIRCSSSSSNVCSTSSRKVFGGGERGGVAVALHSTDFRN
jgi:hypothetical protein